MAGNVLPASIQLDPAGRIAQDVTCLHCNYNLRTLLPEQTCPECNAPVGPSLRSNRLRLADPAWFARVRSGLTWILISSLLGAFATRSLGWAISGVAALSFLPALMRTLPTALLFGIPIYGAWRATTAEPGCAGTLRDSKIRIIARLLLVAFLLLMLVSWLANPAGSPTRPATAADLRWIRLHSAAAGLLYAMGWTAFCLYLSRLGRRAGAPALASLGIYVAVTLALLGLLTSGISLWLALNVPQWTGRVLSSSVSTLLRTEWLALLLAQGLIVLTALLYRIHFRRETQRDGAIDGSTRVAET